MICYASRTGTQRNLRALRGAGWGLLVSPTKWRTEGFKRVAADNGAWSNFQQGKPFDEDRFDRFLDWLATQTVPDWIVLPDIVAGGLRSLELSTRWMNRCRAASDLVLIAVQNGMTEGDLAPLVGPHVGIFLGGSTDWKLANMARWGSFCARHGAYYHVARVNTERRMWMASAAGADSIDGSSASRYEVTLPLLERARRQRDLFGSALVEARLRRG